MDTSDIIALVALILSILSIFLHLLEYRLHWREYRRGERSLKTEITYVHQPEAFFYNTRFVVTGANVGTRSVQIKGARLKLKSGDVFDTPLEEIFGPRSSIRGQFDLKVGDTITAHFVVYEGAYDSQTREVHLQFRPDEVKAAAFVDIDGTEYEKKISRLKRRQMRRQMRDQWPATVKKY